MHRVLEYTLFFVVLLLLQVFLFNNLAISVYIHPLVYVAFLIMLPMDLPHIVVLLLGLVTGVTMDFFDSATGIHTIASLFTAFSRPLLLLLFMGKDTMKEEGIPVPKRVGMAKFIRYITVMVFIHCSVYFLFEAFTFSFLHLTLLRILLSTIITVVFVYFSQMLLPKGRGSSTLGKI